MINNIVLQGGYSEYTRQPRGGLRGRFGGCPGFLDVGVEDRETSRGRV